MRLSRKTKLEKTKRIGEEEKKKIIEFLAKKELSLGDKLGSGGFGTVYSIHTKAKAEFAAKVMVYDKDKEDEIKSEIKAMETFKDHPYCMPMCDHFEVELPGKKSTVLVLPKGESDLLKFSEDRYKKSEPFSKDKMKQMMTTMAIGLRNIHRSKYIHRDIKPENFMLMEGGDVLVVDFGLTIHENDKEEHNPKSGTARYIPYDDYATNEDDQYLKITPKRDVFALGVTFGTLVFKEFYDCFIEANSSCPQNEKMAKEIKTNINMYPHLINFTTGLCKKVKEKHQNSSETEKEILKLICDKMLVSLDKRIFSIHVIDNLAKAFGTSTTKLEEEYNKNNDDYCKDYKKK